MYFIDFYNINFDLKHSHKFINLDKFLNFKVYFNKNQNFFIDNICFNQSTNLILDIDNIIDFDYITSNYDFIENLVCNDLSMGMGLGVLCFNLD